MPFVPAENVVAISVSGFLGGVPVTLTLEVELAAAVTDADLASINAITSGWLTSWYKPLAVDDLNWTVIDSLDQTTNVGPKGRTDQISVIGSVTADPPEPANVAILVSKYTAQRGRSYRGRTFLTGQGEGSTVGSHYLSPGAVSAWGTAYGNWLNTLRTSGFNPVIVSRYANNAPRTAAVTTPITTLVTQSLVASQRGRLGR